MTYEAPTPEELQRVAEHWRRVKLLTCSHGNGFTFQNSVEGPTCSDCGEVLHFLTGIQLEQMRLAPTGDEVRDGLLAQMKRGGVRFAIDGQWSDVRFHAHGIAGSDHLSQCICMQVSEVEKMLRATEVR